jgi:hypothetical protein
MNCSMRLWRVSGFFAVCILKRMAFRLTLFSVAKKAAASGL